MSEPLEKTMRMRTFVLKEILKTERDYVETLRFLVHVFMERLQNREDDENDKLIPPGSVLLLLSNVEDLYKFHQEVLKSIEGALAPEPDYNHKIGDAFLKHKDQFEVYAPYCSNHERAQKKLNELTENQEFQGFILASFWIHQLAAITKDRKTTKTESWQNMELSPCFIQGCLMLGNYVNDVSMEGFLLTPIQRICKYPLLLRELLKKTPTDHPDYEAVKRSLEAMKEVCSNVNETKRQLEQLEKLEDLQATIANWEGANLTDTCTRLIKHGALLKISVGNIQERQFFLFDHLLVYAKKINALPRLQNTESKTGTIQRKKVKKKKSTTDQKKWLFKGRISTELMEIENLEDGASDFHCGGYTITNGWKVLNAAKNKWFVLLAKDKEEKEAWLNEFIMERERRRSKVKIDQRDTIDVMHSRGKRIYYKAMHQKLIRDRKSKMRHYPKSIMGNEFVNWLVEIKEASSVDEGVMLGQALLDCGIIHHVQDKHHFRNESVHYRFRYDDGTFKPRGENQDLVAKGLRIYCRVHCLFQPIVRDKERNLRSYKMVIEAKKLIDWLQDQGDVQSREEAANLGQSLCENAILHHALDKQDFKDDNSLFKFYPDEELGEISKLRDLMKKSSSKQEFKFHESYKTKTLFLLNVSDNEPLGLEVKYIEEKSDVVITSIIKASQAQVQGFQPGMTVLQICNDLLTSCPSQDHLDQVMKYNLEKYKLITFVVKCEDEIEVVIPVTKEGMGFQIRGSNPCVVHAVAKGGMAMNHGLVKGHAIIKVNGKMVTQNSHDDVATAIRDGCKLPAQSKQDKEKIERSSSSPSLENDGKANANNAHTTSSSTKTGIKKTRSFKRQKLAMLVGINHTSIKGEKREDEDVSGAVKSDAPKLELLVGNRHMERTCMYSYVSVNGIKTNVVEKMSESPSIFDLAAQLLEVLVAEDERVLADVQALEDIAPYVADVKSEVFERRRSLRYEVINERLDNYKRYKRHLASYMWPSYKEAKDRPSNLTAKDFCPTNCHVNLLKVSHAPETYNLRGMGLPDSKKDNQQSDIASTVHTTHATTCLASPSFRTRGKGGHGLLAVLRGAEGSSEPMDNIRQLMVALDHALLELRQGQCQLIKILNTEADLEGTYSPSSIRPRYQLDEDSEEIPRIPLTPPTSFPAPLSPNKIWPKSPKTPPAFTPDDPHGAMMAGSDMIQICGAIEKSPGRESLPGELRNSADSGHGGESSAHNTPLRLRYRRHGSRKSGEDNFVAGNESECDSGIHSNRGSMAGSEKLVFNFANSPDSPNGSKPDNTNRPQRTSTASTTNSLNENLTPAGDDPKALKLTSAMQSLDNPPPASPVKMRTGKQTRSGRPTSRVRFSGRDRISLISNTESTCSSDGLDNINFVDLEISPDALDKLQGTMEHFLSKIHSLSDLMNSEPIKEVFVNTQETTPERTYSKIIEGLTACTSDDAVKMSLSVCDDTDQFADVINTLIDSVEHHVNEVRTQLVLSVLLYEDPKLVSRRDKVFSQALITAISSFSAQLRCAIAGTFNNMKAYGVRPDEASRKWLEQCMSIGVCVMFKTMLNPNEQDECSMLEDSYVGVYDLERVSFHFRAIAGDVEPNESPNNVNNDFDGSRTVHIDGNGVGYSMEGNRCALKIFFHLDKHVFIKLPPRLQAGGGVKIVPILINHGLHDLGSLLYEQGVTMQEFSNSINEKALGKAYDYYKRFRAFHLDRSKLPRDTEARAVLVDRLSRPLNALDEVMTLMETNVKARHGKPSLATTGCGVLPLAMEFCQRLGGCSVIACNNGTQRSTTACSLQQALALASCHGLPPKQMLAASFQFGKVGSRAFADVKNPEAKDVFNAPPRLFRRSYSESEPTSPS